MQPFLLSFAVLLVMALGAHAAGPDYQGRARAALALATVRHAGDVCACTGAVDCTCGRDCACAACRVSARHVQPVLQAGQWQRDPWSGQLYRYQAPQQVYYQPAYVQPAFIPSAIFGGGCRGGGCRGGG